MCPAYLILSHLNWFEWQPNLLAQGTLWGWFVVTLALCPCGHYFTPLVVRDSVTLSGGVCDENNQCRYWLAMAQTCSLLLYTLYYLELYYCILFCFSLIIIFTKWFSLVRCWQMTVMHGWGKFSHFLRPCSSNAMKSNQAHSTKDSLKRLLCSIHFAQSVRHSIIPSGIVYTASWSSSVVIVLGLYTCTVFALKFIIWGH